MVDMAVLSGHRIYYRARAARMVSLLEEKQSQDTRRDEEIEKQ